MTYSARSFFASAWISEDWEGSKTIWAIPSRSRRSTKVSPPWSRVEATQPARVTVWVM